MVCVESVREEKDKIADGMFVCTEVNAEAKMQLFLFKARELRMSHPARAPLEKRTKRQLWSC